MEMAFRCAHGKSQGNLVKKRRIGCRYLPSGKIVPYAERQFVTGRSALAGDKSVPDRFGHPRS